jgi:hypothetical protein
MFSRNNTEQEGTLYKPFNYNILEEQELITPDRARGGVDWREFPCPAADIAQRDAAT